MGSDKLKYKKLLWIAPEFNHYRVDMVNSLVGEFKYIKVICGNPLKAEGHKMENEDRITFDTERISCNYRNFGFRYSGFRSITRNIKHGGYDFVMFSIEKKFIFLIILLIFLKARYGFRLFSYNQYIERHINTSSRINYFLLYLASFFYDKIIFYTRNGYEKAISENKFAKDKVGYANNTINVSIGSKGFENETGKNIIFAGRIIETKRIDLLYTYYKELKKEFKDLKAFIIGDGPALTSLREQYSEPDFIYTGSILREDELYLYYSKSRFTLNPGHSGLSIVQSFAYGKPYITFLVDETGKRINHPPEIEYIKNGYNGFLLNNDSGENISIMRNILSDDIYYKTLRGNCIKTYESLSMRIWSEQLINSISR